MIKEIREYTRREQIILGNMQLRGNIQRYYFVYDGNKPVEILTQLGYRQLTDKNKKIYIALDTEELENYKKIAKRGRPIKDIQYGNK